MATNLYGFNLSTSRICSFSVMCLLHSFYVCAVVHNFKVYYSVLAEIYELCSFNGCMCNN